MFDRSRYEPKRVIVASLRTIVRELDVSTITPADAVDLVDWFAEVERLAVAGKTLAAGRAAEGDAWKRAGDRSPADWLARRTGATVADARSTLQTAATLPDAPGTDDAFRAGELSSKQADAVAPAAAADPSAEARLLEIAKYQGLQKLRDEAARVRAAADPDPNARHERIRTQRFWRRYTRPDGSRAGMYAGTPEEVALIEAAAQRFIDARIDQARRSGEHEPSEAYAFDGLLDMATSTMGAGTADDSDDVAPDEAGDPPDGGPDGPQPSPRGGRGRKRLSERRELILICDLAAWRRGYLLPGEKCEIPGIGPIPVDVAHTLFGDALLRIVIRDGVDVRTVVHTGRTANAVQETAVYVQQDGRCGKPTCNLPISEIDHSQDYSHTRITTLDDLLGLCGGDHDNKTRHGHTYRREPDGSITWIYPDGTEERERPPPP